MKKYNTLLASGACKDSSTTPIDERPEVDRKNLGPFVRGYVNAILAQFPLNDLGDITERALQQIIRDCVGFYWRNRKLFEPLWNDPFGEYSEKESGVDFYYSRNGLSGGYISHSDPFDDTDLTWECLEASAIGCGPFMLYLNDEDMVDVRSDPTGWYK